MSPSTIAHAPALKFLKNGALLLCLFAPSLWMIATIPPLWRDVDAYNQLTRDPLLSTFWGHGPAYSYAAKIPLFLGAKWEQWRGIAPSSDASQSSRPPLTDSGTALLILAQHVALCAAAFLFIAAISASFWVRFGLVLLWASNALFYTFAHCAGSETLGMIFIVLLVAQATRIVRGPHEPRWIDWYIFAAALCGCILSRHLNVCLIALLPAAFLLSWAATRARRNLQYAFVAVAIGLSSLTVTSALPRDLARKTQMHPHSRLGYTFLWRLHFMENLSSESRAALFQQVRARAQSREVREVVKTLEQIYAQGRGPDDAAFMEKAIEFFPGMHWEKLDRTLNKMAFLFLWPPATDLLQVAKADFVDAMKTPPTEVSSYLFDTTAYYFTHKEAMPDSAGLVTFRGTSAGQILSIPAQSRYLALWQAFTCDKALLLWLLAVVALITVERLRKATHRTVVPLAITLTLLGLLMFAASCLLVDNQPRFRLPLWQLLFLSFFILIGRTADLLRGHRAFQNETAIAAGKEKSAGQMPSLG